MSATKLNELRLDTDWAGAWQWEITSPWEVMPQVLVC